jgi:hypothetical protein
MEAAQMAGAREDTDPGKSSSDATAVDGIGSLERMPDGGLSFRPLFATLREFRSRQKQEARSQELEARIFMVFSYAAASAGEKPTKRVS